VGQDTSIPIFSGKRSAIEVHLGEQPSAICLRSVGQESAISIRLVRKQNAIEIGSVG
jgi:hypothetical protein